MLQLILLSPFCFCLLISSGFAQDLNSPKELFQIMEKSELAYELHELKKEIPAPDNRMNFNSGDYYQVKEEDGFVLKSVELSDAGAAVKDKAEAAFRSKDYPEARKYYRQLLKIHPEYSKIITYLGQTYQNTGKPDSALYYYRKAIDQNYIDYMAHWFSARNLYAQGKVEEATKEFLIAYVFNPHHPTIKAELTAVMAQQGQKLLDWEFIPQIKLEKKGTKKVALHFNGAWLGYAMAWGIWAFEPGYAEERGEDPENPFIMDAEKEGLFALYIAIENDKKLLKADPALQGLVTAFEEKKVEEFILFERFIKRRPIIAYNLPPELIETLCDYVLKVRVQTLKGKAKKNRKKK